MVNQIDSTRDFSHDIPQRHISETFRSDRTHTTNKFRFEDLIVSLANAHENRRARQVTEWEGIRRRNFPAPA